jgi:glycosyltransferase involved in cell wall biosynthesis
MRVVFIIPSLANKGPVLVVRDLCIGLINQGHECKVLYFDDIRELDMPCPTEHISFNQKIDFSQWDIVHSHMLRPDLWVFRHKSRFKKYSTKFVTTVHQNITQTLTSDYGFLKGFFVGMLWKIMLRKFDRVVVLTYEHIKSLNVVKQSKISVIFNGRDIDFLMPVDKADVEKIAAFRSNFKTIIGTNSIITKRKGLEQIIKALPQLPNIGYVVVGDGVEADPLKKLAKQLGVENQCLWLGARPNGFRYTALFDIYLILSRSEGFPLSLIEAAAWGKPTICSDIPILRSIVSSDQVVFTPLDDAEYLVRTINEVMFDNKGREIVLNSYYSEVLTSEVMCQNYINLYKKVK